MRTALVLICAIGFVAAGCRGAPLVSAVPAATPAPIAAADAAPERKTVFDGLLKTGEKKTPGLFDFDMESVTKRMLEEQERRQLGESTGSFGIRVVPLWGTGRCR